MPFGTTPQLALLRHPRVGVMTVRRLLLITAACVALAILTVTVTLVVSPSDPNRQTAEQVVSQAGVPAGVTPGPGQVGG